MGFLWEGKSVFCFSRPSFHFLIPLYLLVSFPASGCSSLVTISSSCVLHNVCPSQHVCPLALYVCQLYSLSVGSLVCGMTFITICMLMAPKYMLLFKKHIDFCSGLLTIQGPPRGLTLSTALISYHRHPCRSRWVARRLFGTLGALFSPVVNGTCSCFGLSNFSDTCLLFPLGEESFAIDSYKAFSVAPVTQEPPPHGLHLLLFLRLFKGQSASAKWLLN